MASEGNRSGRRRARRPQRRSNRLERGGGPNRSGASPRPREGWAIRDTRAVKDARSVKDATAVKDARAIRDTRAVRDAGRLKGSTVPKSSGKRRGPPPARSPRNPSGRGPARSLRTDRSGGSRGPSGGAENPRSRGAGTPVARRPGESHRGQRQSSANAIRAARSPANLLERQPWESLVSHLIDPQADPERKVALLRRYSELLVDWNHRVSNLISRNDEPRFVDRHLGESLEPAQWMAETGGERWLDFGSGAGLPAIPLAIAGLGSHWTLVESRRTKTLFLRKAISEVGLGGIDVVLGRLEMLVETDAMPPRFDGFTSRATLTLGPTLSLAARVVLPGGSAFLWKGGRREEEMRSDTRWRQEWTFEGERVIGDGRTAVAKFKRIK